MIGTIICRNCDTAIEVSERDVSTFESQGSFGCPSCKEDLSARMADLLGTNRPAPSEERTVEEDAGGSEDAFDGLPVGGSLDDAARAMRVSPAAAPTAPSSGMLSSSAGAVPDVGGEDPLTLALRIAQQAQEQAKAAALEQSDATIDEEPSANAGVRDERAKRASSSVGAGGANGNGAHPEDPSPERTAPGTPFSNGGNGASAHPGPPPGTQVGVIPDEPDNEDTVRARANATQSTVDSAPGSEGTIPEPTVPSESDLIAPDTSDAGPVIGEETPALTEEQRAAMLAEAESESEPDTIVDEPPPARGAAVPAAPTSEATPSAPRPPPPLATAPEEPREEPTIRKTSPPPSLHPPARLAPRTGTGPSGIGALGFRISSNRPVVRPALNGRPSSPGMSTPAAGTPMMGGSTAIERPSERVSIERPLADRPSRTNIPASRPVAPPPAAVAAEPPPVVTGRDAATTDERARPAVPVWMLGVGVGVIATVIVVVLALAFGLGSNPEQPVATPTPTEVVEESPMPEESPATTAVVALPTATSTPSASRTGTPIATITPTPTRVASATPASTQKSTPTATPTAIAMTTAKATATPAATPAQATAKERVQAIVKGKTPARVRFDLFTAAMKPAILDSDPEFLFAAWEHLAKPSPNYSKEDQDASRDMARKLGVEFTTRFQRHPNKNQVWLWIQAYDKSQAPK